MDNYFFTPRIINLTWYTRFHNRLNANHDNRALLKQFRSEFHLDKLESENISYSLPKIYPIATNEITYLYHVRDRIINRLHSRHYATAQNAADDYIKELESEYSFLKKRRITEKAELDRLKIKLRNTKTSLDHIAVEANIATAKAKLENTDSAILNNENKKAELVRIKKSNLADWRKQVKSVEKIIEIAIGNYIKRSTRNIELRYGFTNFTHNVAKYDADMIKTTEGDY